MKFVIFSLYVVSLFLVPTITMLSGFGATLASERTSLLEPIIISSSRIPTTLDSAVANTTVIDRETIRASNANNIVDILRHQSGIYVEQAGSRGAFGSIYLRNSDPSFVAVIIDGIKVNDPTNTRGGSFDFSSLDINSIERIEIIRGSLSSMHGSDALAGVIYITTIPVKEKAESQATVSVGTQHYQEANGRFQQRYKLSDISLNVGYVDEGDQLKFTGFVNRIANLRANSFLAKGVKLSVFGRHNESDAKSLPDDSGGEDFVVIQESEKRKIRESTLGLSLNHDVTADWSYSFAINNFRHTEKVDSPGVAPGIRNPFGIPENLNDSNISRTYGIWNNSVELNNHFQFSAGLDVQREKGESDSVLDPGGSPIAGSYFLERDNQGAFLELLYRQGDRFSAKLGARYDDPDTFDSQFTSNVGFRYRIANYSILLTAGSGYKLPSFFALGNPIVGNSGLVPEKSDFWEFGIERVVQSLNWKISVYSYEFEDLVDFDVGPPPGLVNRSVVTSDGVEASVRSKLNDKEFLSANVMYSDTNIEGTNVPLLNRPRWRAAGQYQRDVSRKVSAMLSFLYVGKVYDSSIPTAQVELDAYYRVDLSANWRPSRVWNIGAVIENITDRSYQETVGTDSPGLAFRLSATATH